MTGILLLIGSVVYLLGGLVTTYLCGRYGGRDADDPSVVFICSAAWPLLVVAAPFVALYALGRKKKEKP